MLISFPNKNQFFPSYKLGGFLCTLYLKSDLLIAGLRV